MTYDVEKLAGEFKAFKEQDAKRWELLIASQEENTRAINALTAQTEGVIQVYNDIRGAVRVGVSVQKFTAWLAKTGTIGAAAAVVIYQILENYQP